MEKTNEKMQENCLQKNYCVKSVRIQSFSGPYFPAFQPNTEIYRRRFAV